MKTYRDDDWWCKPTMNVESQIAFWDAMSEIYENADMTVDNQKEIDVVIKKYREIQCQDIITLGGAVGCRDPKVLLEDLISRDIKEKKLPVVFFNDLSNRQVLKAKEFVLKPFTDKGLTINYLPGEIKNICKNIPSKPRRLIIGVYNCHSFFNAHPSDGYPISGFDEYLKNNTILGYEFLFDWVKLIPDHRIVSCGLRAKIDASAEQKTRDQIKNLIDISRSEKWIMDDVTALQIIGRHYGNPGFFISHWYTQRGFLELLESVFSPDQFIISTETFAKGMVFVVDQIGVKPSGVVTVLNNVIGNVLPDDQFETLGVIKEIII